MFARPQPPIPQLPRSDVLVIVRLIMKRLPTVFIPRGLSPDLSTPCQAHNRGAQGTLRLRFYFMVEANGAAPLTPDDRRSSNRREN
jgi:hypothetical protein